MWSDTLLGLERSHLVRLTAWGMGSLVTGVVLLVWIRVRSRVVPFIGQFALQMVAWGILDLAIVSLAWSRLTLRDYAGAFHLQDQLWLDIGLDAACAAVGLTLVIACLRLAPRAGGVGAGFGLLVQALARLLLNTQFLLSIGHGR